MVIFTLHDMFYYLMNLHYSQTRRLGVRAGGGFYYLMNLHYSQTTVRIF